MRDALVDCLMAAGAGLVAGGLVLLVSSHSAKAHSFYDPKCCSGTDCAPVSEVNLKPVKGGWRLHIAPGEHPTVKQVIDVLIPYGDPKIHPSPDGQPHACVGPNTQVIFCIYVPDFGS